MMEIIQSKKGPKHVTVETRPARHSPTVLKSFKRFLRAWFAIDIVQKQFFLLKNQLGTWRKNHTVKTTAKFYSTLIDLKYRKGCVQT